jgi:hypothetical protein
MLRVVITACIALAPGMGQARADVLLNTIGEGWINNGNHGSDGDIASNN